MHEYSVVQAMFESIESIARERHAVAVRRVAVRIGRAAGIDVDLLRTAYDNARVRTICAEAPLDVSEVPVRWSCAAGHGELAPGAPLACPCCGRPARLESGDEIVLERLDLEVP